MGATSVSLLGSAILQDKHDQPLASVRSTLSEGGDVRIPKRGRIGLDERLKIRKGLLLAGEQETSLWYRLYESVLDLTRGRNIGGSEASRLRADMPHGRLDQQSIKKKNRERHEPEANEEGALRMPLQELDGLLRGHIAVEPTARKVRHSRLTARQPRAKLRTSLEGVRR